jgi:hypothetical protein
MLQAIAMVVAVDKRNKASDAIRSPTPQPPPPIDEPEAPSARWAPDWKHLLVSFAVGALVSMLVGQQWRLYQKKRQQKLIQEPGGVPAAMNAGATVDVKKQS